MEASRIARDYKENDSESYVVSSSFSDFEEPDRVAPREIVEGLFPSYSRVLPRVPTTIQVVTVTSTTTSFSLIASAVKKPVVIATLITIPSAAGPPVISATTTGGVLCLPPGYVVC